MRIEDNFAQNEVLFNNKFQNISSDKSTDEKSNNVGFGDVLKNCIDDTNDKMVNLIQLQLVLLRVKMLILMK